MFSCIIILGWKVSSILILSWLLNLFYLHINISLSYCVIMATKWPCALLKSLCRLTLLPIYHGFLCPAVSPELSWSCQCGFVWKFWIITDLALSPFKIVSYLQFIYFSLFCLAGKTKFYYIIWQININPVRLNSPLKLTWLHKNMIQIRTLCGFGVFTLDLCEV